MSDCVRFERRGDTVVITETLMGWQNNLHIKGEL